MRFIMGMYDELKCKYPIQKEHQNLVFQTKSLHCVLAQLEITEDGKLIDHEFHFEEVPQKDRPFYGKPEWDNPIKQMIGSLKKVEDGPRELDHTGEICFYTFGGQNKHNITLNDSDPYVWIEYKAWFVNGQLKDIVACHSKK